MERGLSEQNKVLNVNMHQISITSRKFIIDQMLSHSLLQQSFTITKSLLKSVRCSRQRFEELLREKELLCKQNAQCALLAIINKEIEDVRNSIAETIKISKTFVSKVSEFLRLLDEVGKKRNFQLFSRGNILKKK